MKTVLLLLCGFLLISCQQKNEAAVSASAQLHKGDKNEVVEKIDEFSQSKDEGCELKDENDIFESTQKPDLEDPDGPDEISLQGGDSGCSGEKLEKK